MIQQGLFGLTTEQGGAAKAEGYTLTYRSGAEVSVRRGKSEWVVFGYESLFGAGTVWDVYHLPEDVRPAVAALLKS